MPHDLLVPTGVIGAVVLIWLFSRRTGGGTPPRLNSPPTPISPLMPNSLSVSDAQGEHNYHFRIAQLEAKVSFLMDKLGVVYDAPADDQIRGYLMRGMKIEAIQAYRSQNPGVGLKDAKDAVEALESRIKAQQS